MTRSRPLAALLFALAALSLTGCAAQGTHFAGVPNPEHVVGETATSDAGISASWFVRGAEIAITTWGSSTCPVSGNWIHVVKPRGEGNTVSIDLNPIAFDGPAPDGPAPDGGCTADRVPHTTLFYTPGAVTTTEPLRILIAGEVLVLPIK